MAKVQTTERRCIIIAGPNGAGKTTFAREFLPKDTDIVHFVNADLIAAGRAEAVRAKLDELHRRLSRTGGCLVGI